MKTKKVILGSLVLVFAIGSSIASSLLISPVFVKAIVDNNGTPVEDCVAINTDCDNATSAELCEVTVFTEDEGVQTALGYPDNGCTTALRHSTVEVSGDPVGNITILSLVEPIE